MERPKRNDTYLIKPLEELTLMDDYMFEAVMREPENLKPLLEYILETSISEITFVEPQKTEKEGYTSHGIRLDLYVCDDRGKIMNVEVQTSKVGSLPKRMRYYQSVIDINVLSPGADYKTLPESYVIFICNYDPYENEQRYIYHFENRCLESPDLAFGDETTKIIVNTGGSVGEISRELREVLIYLDKGIAAGPYTRQLDEAVCRIKSSEVRRHEYMVMMIREMEIREAGRAEGREEGREEGRAEGIIDTLISLVKDGILTIEEASVRAGVTEAAFRQKMEG